MFGFLFPGFKQMFKWEGESPVKPGRYGPASEGPFEGVMEY